MIYRYLLILGIALTLCSCIEPSEQSKDDFDRSTLLEEWADNHIIPSFEAYRNSLSDLKLWVLDYQSNATEQSLESLRLAYETSYENWQNVASFNIGKAEEIQLINYTNIYPTDTSKVLFNIQTTDYNLLLPSNYVAQGFPAIDYLLFGRTNSQEALQFLDAEKTEYLVKLIDQLLERTTEVTIDWTSTYRENFISQAGSSATASVDKVVNDYIYYLEKHVRAAKVGIPAGVFSGGLLPQNVEAVYAEDINKKLLDVSIAGLKSFYQGRFNGTDLSEQSLASYVEFIDSKIGSENLNDRINRQFDSAFAALDALDSSLQSAVETDNTKMLALYDELQKLVILFKVDMLQLLNIQVDYVDADGD